VHRHRAVHDQVRYGEDGQRPGHQVGPVGQLVDGPLDLAVALLGLALLAQQPPQHEPQLAAHRGG
jgi:hypothetical protein